MTKSLQLVRDRDRGVVANMGNDNWRGAMPISGARGSIEADNTNATMEFAADESWREEWYLAVNYNSIWFRWRAPRTGGISFDTFQSDLIDTMMGVFTGTPIPPDQFDAYDWIIANDDTYNEALDWSLHSKVTFLAEQDTVYYIQVGSWSDDSVGRIVLSWYPDEYDVSTDQSFGFTGAPQTLTIPANVSLIQVEASGAGMSSAYRGAQVTDTFVVEPGQEYEVIIGGTTEGSSDVDPGGWPDGGDSGDGGGLFGSRGGGGSTSLIYGGNQILVAGGAATGSDGGQPDADPGSTQFDGDGATQAVPGDGGEDDGGFYSFASGESGDVDGVGQGGDGADFTPAALLQSGVGGTSHARGLLALFSGYHYEIAIVGISGVPAGGQYIFDVEIDPAWTDTGGGANGYVSVRTDQITELEGVPSTNTGSLSGGGGFGLNDNGDPSTRSCVWTNTDNYNGMVYVHVTVEAAFPNDATEPYGHNGGDADVSMTGEIWSPDGAPGNGGGGGYHGGGGGAAYYLRAGNGGGGSSYSTGINTVYARGSTTDGYLHVYYDIIYPEMAFMEAQQLKQAVTIGVPERQSRMVDRRLP